MIFRLAIAGDLTDRVEILEKVDGLVSELTAMLRTRQGEHSVGTMVSPAYTADSWRPWVKKAGLAVSNYCMSDDTRWTEEATRIIREDTPVRGVLGEAVCDRADLILVVWNEDVSQMETAVWELMQLAHGRKTPCVWISSVTGQVYWSEGSYFDPYESARLEKLCAIFGQTDAQPVEFPEKRIPLLGLGN